MFCVSGLKKRALAHCQQLENDCLGHGAYAKRCPTKLRYRARLATARFGDLPEQLVTLEFVEKTLLGVEGR
jgi:hypothetical protein